MNTHLTKVEVIPYAVAVLAIAMIGIMLAFNTPKPALAGSFPSDPTLSVATTSKAQAITTSARVLATTTNPLAPDNSFQRSYAVICNPNPNPVVINMNGDQPASLPLGHLVAILAATSTAGYDVCYEITDKNKYYGSVTASSTNGQSTTITVTEYVY